MDPRRGMGGYFLITPSSTETYLPFCLSKNVKEVPNLAKLCTVAGDPDNFCNFWTLSYAFHHSQLPHISFNNCQIVTSSFIAFFFSVKFLSKKTFNSSIYLLDANCQQSRKSANVQLVIWYWSQILRRLLDLCWIYDSLMAYKRFLCKKALFQNAIVALMKNSDLFCKTMYLIFSILLCKKTLIVSSHLNLKGGNGAGISWFQHLKAQCNCCIQGNVSEFKYLYLYWFIFI